MKETKLGIFDVFRNKKLENAERANEPFWVSCELCHNPCKALGKPLGPGMIPVMTADLSRRVARYCKKCNIIMCGACAGVPLFVTGTTHFTNQCPRCGEFMEYAAACHVKKIKAKLV